MLGTSESWLGALAVELGHRDVALALLATVPLLCGALAQLASPLFVRALGGEKRWVVVGAFLQALVHVALLAMAWTDNRSLGLLLAAKIAYWVSGMATAPAWSAWMARLLPPRIRARYFARRASIAQLCLLVSFLASGFLLEAFRGRGATLTGFTVLYAAALIARLSSAAMIARKSYVAPAVPAPQKAALARAVRGGRWRVALYVSAVLFGAQLAIPYFTPYMLRTLSMSFTEFAWLTAISVAAKTIAFAAWQRAPRRAAFRTLVVSGAVMALGPLPWAFFTSFAPLAVAQVVAGIAWAGYELTTLELLMGDAPGDAIVEFYALASSLAGATQVAGALLGGVALRSGWLDFQGVFIASTIARGAALVLLLPVLPRELHPVRVLTRVIGTRPTTGAVRAPVIANRARARARA